MLKSKALFGELPTGFPQSNLWEVEWEAEWQAINLHTVHINININMNI